MMNTIIFLSRWFACVIIQRGDKNELSLSPWTNENDSPSSPRQQSNIECFLFVQNEDDLFSFSDQIKMNPSLFDKN